MGIRAVRAVVECARELGIPYLTLYAFSIENWGRLDTEVSTLMELLQKFLVEETPELRRRGIRLWVIGDRRRLPPRVLEALEAAISATSSFRDMTLTLALSYAGRDEIARAAARLAADAAAGRIDPAAVTEKDLAARLDTAGMPDPDLVIRTSGEQRISNFLLWQSAYAEFVFTEVLWPDFGKADFLQALEEYQRRERRFGLAGGAPKAPPAGA